LCFNNSSILSAPRILRQLIFCFLDKFECKSKECCMRFWLNLRAEFLGQRQQLLPIVEPVYKTTGYAFKPYLCTDQSAGQHGAGHILSATVYGMQDGRFEVVSETGCKVIGCGKLVVDGARHAINNRGIPSRFDFNASEYGH
jgi:hypothetical protein